MQKIIAILLILLAISAQSQTCIKYDNALKEGVKYLKKKNYEKALKEFQAAQIAARECGISTKVPADDLELVFKGLQAQKRKAEYLQSQAEKDRNIAEIARDSARNAILITQRTLGYFFKNDTDEAAWIQNVSTGKYGIIDKSGQLLGEGFVWENPNAFKGEFALAKRNDTVYFIHKSGKIISKGYKDILKTEFPMYYYAASFNDKELPDNLVFYNGNAFESFINVKHDFYIDKPNAGIFPFRAGQKIGFIDKKNNQFLSPVYDELKIPENAFKAPILMAARKNGKWDLIDLGNSKLLDADLSLAKLERNSNNAEIKRYIGEGDSIVWTSLFTEDKFTENALPPWEIKENLLFEHSKDSVPIEKYYPLIVKYDSLANLFYSAYIQIKTGVSAGLSTKIDSFFEYDSYIIESFEDLDIYTADSVSLKEYTDLDATYKFLVGTYSSLLDELQLNVDSFSDYERFTYIGEETSEVQNPRFIQKNTPNGVGIVNSTGEEILMPEYEMVRYYIGDSIFIVVRKEIKSYPATTSYVCRLFNASNGLFFTYESERDSIQSWWKGIWFKGPSDKNNPPKFDYSMYFMKNGIAIPTFNNQVARMDIFNRETRIIKTRPYNDGTFILSLDGNILNRRNQVGFLRYLDLSKTGIYNESIYGYGKFGLMNADGSILTPPLFDDISIPSEGKHIARIKDRVKDKYGFIDSTGWILPFDYDTAMAFIGGKACVSKNGKYGFIDHKGKIVIPFSYDELQEQFAEGLVGAKKGNKWGFISEKDKWVINPVYDEVVNFNKGVANVKKNGEWGFIDKTNRNVHPFTLDVARSSVDNGWARVKKRGKWGFFNVRTSKTILHVYDTVSPFSGNYAWAVNNPTWMIIDTNGKQVFESKEIVSVTPLVNGYAIVKTDNGEGILDSIGNQIIPYDRRNVIKFYSQVRKIYVANDSIDKASMLQIKEDGKIAWKKIKKIPNLNLINGLSVTDNIITNSDGDILLRGNFYSPEMIAYRTYELHKGEKKGYAAFTDYGTGADDTSRAIKLIRFLAPEYDQIGFPLNQEFMPVKKEGKWGFIQWTQQPDGTEQPNLTIQCKYDAVVPFIHIGNEKIAVVAKGSNVYFINEREEVMFTLYDKNNGLTNSMIPEEKTLLIEENSGPVSEP